MENKKDKNIELFKKYKETKDEKIREEIILLNIGLAKNIVIRFKNENLDIEELMSVAIESLIKAVDNYDLSKNNAFSSFAYVVIKRDILVYMKKTFERLNNCVSVEEIYSINDSDKIDFYDIYEDKSQEKIDEHIELLEQKEESKELIERSLNVLTDREKKIMQLRYSIGFNKAYTITEVANYLNISKQAVSQTERKALRKLKKEIIRVQRKELSTLKLKLY